MDYDKPMYINNDHIENVESYISLGQRYNTSYKKQARSFKEESWPDGQNSPNTAISSSVTLEHV
ncbi:hypothetical protein NP493_52g05012 [Ridgeia piscesae]|uniref:Uncharacterized protein n=1 Tax=Ridgeia piscesae TaxID=27915 RepID=A0AAD9UJF9_RIDPI|nr:hypothetical protein NP493_52g05012 [Ridgeia piscesae]